MSRKTIFRILACLILLFLFVIAWRLLVRKEQRLSEMGFVPGYLLRVASPFLSQLDTSSVDSVFYGCERGITRYKTFRYPGEPSGYLNKEGFRSPEFLPKDQRKKGSILVGLFGDSFTFGSSAHPLSNCFADQLRNDTSLYVDNMGVEGSDMQQYLLLAEWYVPRFQPDILYVVLSKSDYDAEHTREIVPYQPMYYTPKLGIAFPAFDICGKFQFHNLKESVDYYENTYTLNKKTGFFAKWMAKSNVGTQFYKNYFWNDPEKACPRNPVTWRYLEKIDSICKANHVAWKPVILRGRDDPDATDSVSLRKNYGAHLKDFTFLFPQLSDEDFVKGADSHTNNSGHAKIAAMLREDIRRTLAFR